MKINKVIAIAALLLLSSNVAATGFMVEGGLHLGGDTIVEAQFTNGEKDKLKGGELLSAAIGLHTELGDFAHMRLTIGYKFDVITATNGEVDFTRVPINLLLMFPTAGKWMLGAGVTQHSSPEISATAASIGVAGTAELDDAQGVLLEFSYSSSGQWSEAWVIGGRITLIDYENQFGSFNGNSIGVVMGYLF